MSSACPHAAKGPLPPTLAGTDCSVIADYVRRNPCLKFSDSSYDSHSEWTACPTMPESSALGHSGRCQLRLATASGASGIELNKRRASGDCPAWLAAARKTYIILHLLTCEEVATYSRVSRFLSFSRFLRSSDLLTGANAGIVGGGSWFQAVLTGQRALLHWSQNL